MDWFEKLTGFREESYDDTKAKLQVDGPLLRSLINGATFQVGRLELVSLSTLREMAKFVDHSSGHLKVDIVVMTSGISTGLRQTPVPFFKWPHNSICSRWLDLMLRPNMA